MTKRESTKVEPSEENNRSESRFLRITAFIVALENYRTPSKGEPLPSVDFAHADGEAFADVIQRIYADLPDEAKSTHVLKDDNASFAALRDELRYTIKNLSRDELFIFYYAGHGFHGAGGNRLSTYDTNRTNIEDTSLLMREHILDPLAESRCSRALVFVDACAERFRTLISSRDVISNLDAEELERFLDDNSYFGIFLSCSPGEKSYPSTKLNHGIWSYFLLNALEGRATEALTRDRWLTDFGLRDYLRQEVPRFITREMTVRGSQTPQAILSGSGSFQIPCIPQPPTRPADAALAAIALQNDSEYLEGTETGKIRNLSGFQRRIHNVPSDVSDSARDWCRKLLTTQVAEELQGLYEASRAALNVRRKDIQKAQGAGAADLDTAAFRYSIETGQNPNDPSEYIIQRRLELRQGWDAHRAAIDKIFSNKFDRLVIEFQQMDDTFDELVGKLEDIQKTYGGDIHDDDRTMRATYKRDKATFTFDLKKRRLEISFGESGTLQLVDAARQFQLGNSRASPMLATSRRQPTIYPVPRNARQQ